MKRTSGAPAAIVEALAQPPRAKVIAAQNVKLRDPVRLGRVHDGPMDEGRDYLKWHERYDDPESDLAWRLSVVRGFLRDALDRHPGPVRVLSVCAGDGRDILGVLSERDDADRVEARVLVRRVDAEPDLGALREPDGGQRAHGVRGLCCGLRRRAGYLHDHCHQ